MWLLCQWALDPSRAQHHSHLPIATSLLSRLVYRIPSTSGDILDSGNPFPLQRLLMAILDHSLIKHSDDDVKMGTHISVDTVARLYGDFMQGRIFSHSLYYRTLVSRGILDISSDASTPDSHSAEESTPSASVLTADGSEAVSSKEKTRLSLLHRRLLTELPLFTPDRSPVKRRTIALYGHRSV